MLEVSSVRQIKFEPPSKGIMSLSVEEGLQTPGDWTQLKRDGGGSGGGGW